MGEPVGPAHHQAHPPAKGPLGIDPPAAGLGQAGGQLGHAHGAQQGVEPAHPPGHQDQAGAAQLGSHQARGAQNAGADGAAHGSRQPKTQPQNAEQLALAFPGHGAVRSLWVGLSLWVGR